MMETFIERVAKDILNQQQDPSQTLLIIPNNRAALFLKNALVQNSKKSVILPKIITISEFISRLSGVQVANKTDLLFDFYNCFRASKIEGQSQSFLEFYKWGKVVLSDFNEIDNHLINPDKIFTHINATYALEAWSPDSSALTDFQKKYINLWANLRLLYEKFKNRLIATGKGYSGLVKKIALQRIESGIWDLPYTFDHLHFIGFSALSESEKQIIQNAILQKGACVHWDTDSYYIDNPNNEAGLFLRRYKKDKTLSSTFSESENYLLQNEKNIRILKCQTNVVQVEILNEILKKNQARNTAVVLCDEQLIVPVLNAIPKNQTDINVTLGFPVNVTSVFSHWLEFIRFQCEPGKFEKSKLRLLSENWVWHSLDSQKDLNDDSISDGFAHNLQISEPLLKEYMAVKSKDLPNLIRILVEIAKSILKKENDNDPEDFNTQINKLFHQKLIIILKKLGSMIEAHEVDLEHSEMLFIFKQLMKDEKIDIVGQPTRGIQIMGVLETRVLDFDHLIMLSMNEGDLPKGNNENSIIPLDLKKAYQLPTYSDKDGIFAYHFYRLLQRASHVDLLYSSSATGLNQPEKSRFIEQIEQELVLQNRKISISSNEALVDAADDEVKVEETYMKSEIYKQLLAEYLKRGVSSSAVNTYVSCGKDFYHKYFLGLRDQSTDENLVENSDFGTMVHTVLEELYKPLLGKQLTVFELQEIKKNVRDVASQVLRSYLDIRTTPTGRNYLVFDSIVKYITRFIQWDIEECSNQKERIILALEADLKKEYTIDNQQVLIRGKIDRLEKVQNYLRIIDYKTGSVHLRSVAWEEFESFKQFEHHGLFIQLMFYFVLAKEHYPEYDFIHSGLISLKTISSGYQYEDFTLLNNIEERFEKALTNMVMDLKDSNTEIEHNENAKYCLAC